MKTLIMITAWLIIPITTICAQQPAVQDTLWETLAPGVISLPDIRETSPSMTADGNTLVFARTKDWSNKTPYIATRKNRAAEWRVEKLPFADTLYNLAISPDGQSIFFKQYDMVDTLKVSRVYKVDRTADGWSEPRELENLFNINAGYFCPMADGRLYFFARPESGKGIFYTEPQGDGAYGDPQRLAKHITSFDIFMHPEEDKFIYGEYFSDEDFEAGKGSRGFYLYRKTAEGWDEGEFIEELPYGWGATVTPDEDLIFVDAGDLQMAPLEALGIEW